MLWSRGILDRVTYPNQALPREFRMAGGGFGRLMVPFVFLLVFFAAVMLLLGSVFAGLAGGIIAAVAGTGVLVGVLYRKFDRMKQGTVVRFSEYGVELRDTLGFHVRLDWPDITRIDEVRSQLANPTTIGRAGGTQVGAGAVRTQGIIGWGHRVVPGNAPAWLRQNVAAAPVNPYDGRPEVAIPLGGIDPDWLRGPMGQWVRMYRPDLLGGAQYGQSPW
ncbi:hypothetical protein [Actinophytocola glycyrrhizae]|uniref:Uncharacterized protein n=1 Tax=Actinophytocola glycyrrhizae TaxID=2044873 RepID=A0ABV9S8B5_9PSEU